MATPTSAMVRHTMLHTERLPCVQSTPVMRTTSRATSHAKRDDRVYTVKVGERSVLGSGFVSMSGILLSRRSPLTNQVPCVRSGRFLPLLFQVRRRVLPGFFQYFG